MGGGAGSAGTSAGGTGGGIATCPAPLDLGVRFVGRTDGCDPTGVRYAWPGSGFVGSFKGTGVSVRLNDAPNQYTVLLDGELMPTLKTSAGEKAYPLATGLDDGEHTFEVYRRTEASFGNSLALGFEVEGGELGAPPPALSRRIEVIGDSITCGYGNEGMLPCTFSADTENHYLSYASLLARSLGAELSTVAWSGKGVIYNYNGDKLMPLPTLYDRAVPSDRKSVWDFSFQPDAVVINLSTNDYSTGNSPSDPVFLGAYQTFLEHLRNKYPSAFILCTVGPMLSGNMLENARRNIAAAVAARASAGDTRVKAYEMKATNPSPGCDYHPNLATHVAMASELEGELKADLSW
jgi:lysophospholipase L1-like esterase